MPATETPSLRAAPPAHDRQALIRQARHAWLDGGPGGSQNLGHTPIEPWITRSWQRCLADGLRPHHSVEFGPVSASTQRQLAEGNRELTARNRYPDIQVGLASMQMGNRLTASRSLARIALPSAAVNLCPFVLAYLGSPAASVWP